MILDAIVAVLFAAYLVVVFRYRNRPEIAQPMVRMLFVFAIMAFVILAPASFWTQLLNFDSTADEWALR